jgi:Zn-dependent metalloprotease
LKFIFPHLFNLFVGVWRVSHFSLTRIISHFGIIQEIKRFEVVKSRNNTNMDDPTTVQANEVGGKEERIDLYGRHKAFNVSPGAIRKKITMFLATKEMTHAEFINAMDSLAPARFNDS